MRTSSQFNCCIFRATPRWAGIPRDRRAPVLVGACRRELRTGLRFRGNDRDGVMEAVNRQDDRSVPASRWILLTGPLGALLLLQLTRISKIAVYLDAVDRSGLIYAVPFAAAAAMLVIIRYPRLSLHLLAVMLPFNFVGGYYDNSTLLILAKIGVAMLSLAALLGAAVEALRLAEWRRVMDVNLDANLALLSSSHALLKCAPRGGRVVVIGSKNVPAPGPGAAAYSAFARLCAWQPGHRRCAGSTIDWARRRGRLTRGTLEDRVDLLLLHQRRRHALLRCRRQRVLRAETPGPRLPCQPVPAGTKCCWHAS